jgi:transcriptional regulator with XRE-family HTH domain
MDNLAIEKLPEDKNFSERLSQAIEMCPLKGKEIAERAGIDPGYLSNLKQGKRAAPSGPVAKALAAALDVSVQWLVAGEGPMGKSQLVRCFDLEDTAKVLSQTIDKDSVYLQLHHISMIRHEIIECIQNEKPPPSTLLAEIGQLEAFLVNVSSQMRLTGLGRSRDPVKY